METADLHSVDEDVLLAYWHNEYERGVEKNGFGRQGHGSIEYLPCPNVVFSQHHLIHELNTMALVVP